MGKETGLAVVAQEALETLEESESCRERQVEGEDAKDPVLHLKHVFF